MVPLKVEGSTLVDTIQIVVTYIESSSGGGVFYSILPLKNQMLVDWKGECLLLEKLDWFDEGVLRKYAAKPVWGAIHALVDRALELEPLWEIDKSSLGGDTVH